MTNSSHHQAPTENQSPHLNLSPHPNLSPHHSSPYHSLSLYLKQLKLPYILKQWEDIEQKAMQENWSYAQFLLALCELEANRRWSARLQRAITEAQLPNGKTLANFDWKHIPNLSPTPLFQLIETTDWLHRGENILLFGPSGVGKTHLAAAVARKMLELGKRVKFFSALSLVQLLQQARSQLQLQPFLRKLDRFDLLLIDDLGYVKKSEAETSVLFELIAHRYETKSLLITANQPFSQWDNIFADSIMTVAAIDRLIHHALIIDIQAESYRKLAAQNKAKNLSNK